MGNKRRECSFCIGYEEKEMENVIRRLLIGLVILDDKKSIDISVQIIENDGSISFLKNRWR